MSGLLIGGMIGLGVGIIWAMDVDSHRTCEWVGSITASALIFAGIGWLLSLIPEGPQCEAPAVSVSTPRIKGCMQPHQLENIDPEVLER